MVDKTASDYYMLVTPPEEAALEAWKIVVHRLVEPLGIRTEDASMSLKDRVLSNNGIVAESVARIGKEEDSVYLKGPGITPKLNRSTNDKKIEAGDNQVVDTIIALENAKQLVFTDQKLNEIASEIRNRVKPKIGWTQGSLMEFAEELSSHMATIGSPNAIWRDKNLVNLYRGATEHMVEASTATPPHIDENTPLFVSAFPAEKGKNLEIARTDKKAKVNFYFVDEDGIEVDLKKPATLADGSAIRVITHNEQDIKNWCKEAIESNPDAELIHGTKQTVLKTTNNKLISWMNDVVKELGRQDSIAQIANKDGKFNGLLVDDLFARMSSTPPKDKATLILTPDASYSDYVKETWDMIKAGGGLKVPANAEVARASATQDHYSAAEFEAKSNGRVIAKDENGNVVLSKDVKKGEVGMFTFFDRERVESYVENTLKRAVETGKEKVLFGFDQNSEYYSVAQRALEKVAHKFTGLEIEIGSPAKLTAKYFTGGGDNTILCLGNIHGDFATDIELTGKGTSYSRGPIPGGRGRQAIELGTGGTAPDLLKFWKEEGYFKFNPMAFVEGVGFGIKNLSELMKKDGLDADSKRYEKLAEAVDKAIYASTCQGTVVPAIKDKFKLEADVCTVVSTRTFVANIELNALNILKDQGEKISADIIKEKTEMLEKLKAADIAIMNANKEFGNEFKKANKIYNTAREESGHIDAFAPNYDIELPLADIKGTSGLTAKNIMQLQQARVNYIQADGQTAKNTARQECISALIDLGVDNLTAIRINNTSSIFTSKNQLQ